MKNAFALPFSMVNESTGVAGNDKRVEVYSIMAMLCVFSFVGIVGNAIVIFVYTRGKMGQGQQQTATVFIVTLAIGDLIASSMTMPFTMAFEYTEYGFSNLFTCRLYGLLLTSTIPFSSLVMVGIAIDRYLCICHPFKRIMNVPRAIAMVMLFTVIACTYGALGSTLYNVILDPECNETYITNSSANSSYWEDYAFPQDYDLYAAGAERNLSISASVAGAGAETTTISSVDSLSNCRLLCDENGAGKEFIFQLYQNFNFGLFMVVVLVVSVLYTLIYSSVSNQRRKKSRMLGRGRSTVTNNEDDTQDLRFMTESSTGSGSTGRNGSEANGHSRKQGTLKKLSLAYKKQSMVHKVDEVHKGRQGDERMRNLKMAFMLFIVTIVFVISFMPCIILLIISIVDPGASTPGVLFYMYFMMNAANPVIYCFMNPNFRQSLNVLFRRK